MTSPLCIACVHAHTRGGALHQSASLCASVHSGREISKSKIVQLVSSGVSAAYVANVRHQGTKRDEKRPACRSNSSAGEKEKEREKERGIDQQQQQQEQRLRTKSEG